MYFFVLNILIRPSQYKKEQATELVICKKVFADVGGSSLYCSTVPQIDFNRC